jgi:hypothetical protein
MRASIAAACLIVLAIGVTLLIETPDLDPRRLPPGGRAIAYLGIALAWGFVGVGAYAWIKRPDNRTGALMTLTVVGVALSGLQLLQVPALFTLGALVDTSTTVAAVNASATLAPSPSGRLTSSSTQSGSSSRAASSAPATSTATPTTS